MTDQKLTKEEKQVLFHTLGLDYGTVAFRNMFLSGEGHHDTPHILSLCEKGLMVEHGKANQGTYYHATVGGCELALALRASEEPRLTRAQRRYRQYLNCDSSMTFFEWITHPYGAKAYGL